MSSSSHNASTKWRICRRAGAFLSASARSQSTCLSLAIEFFTCVSCTFNTLVSCRSRKQFESAMERLDYRQGNMVGHYHHCHQPAHRITLRILKGFCRPFCCAKAARASDWSMLRSLSNTYLGHNHNQDANILEEYLTQDQWPLQSM